MRVWFCVMLLAVSGCSRVDPYPDWVKFPNDPELEPVLSGQALLGRRVEPKELPEQDLFALSPDMQLLAEELAQIHGNRVSRSQALHRSLLNPPMRGGMGISYSAYRTQAAADAFAERQVNCLSFTLMYVAMAREMGLEAQVNQVDIPPQWDLREGGSLTYFRHVNAKVHFRNADGVVVDLEMDRYSPRFPQRTISDREMEAQFYNNRGMEELTAGQTKEAFINLRKALSLTPDAAYLWSNLGNLYRRQGLYEEAELAYLQGLELEPANLTVISNLHNFYSLTQDHTKARYFGERAREHRDNNPYYVYARAYQALQQKDLEQARTLIERAIAMDDEEPRFYRLAARIYERQGAEQKALAMHHKADQQRERLYF